ncbi:MAG: SH3 domain-containing protein [Clostridia bacterium]|nr:SH3 domain-containing protein [Clostridia bacterium]
MKIINFRVNKKSIFHFSLVAILLIFCMFTVSFGMEHYYKLDFSTGIVTASQLNVRSGPGIGYKVVTVVNKNEYIRVFAGVGDWYIVQVEGDYIGAVKKDYVKAIYPSGTLGNTTSNNKNTSTKTANSTMNNDEKEIFDLINKQRTSSGLSALKLDNEVQRVARIKAQDIVDNNYFSHNSPTYGSPFDMLKSFKILYQTAGENIAANSNNNATVTAWMNSSGHKANILNSSFNYTGVGVVNSPQYGKIYVQLFIGK